METPWVYTERRETGLIEHICEHNVGHPAYGSADYQHKVRDPFDDDPNVDYDITNTWFIHGCDGCCDSDEWEMADLREGVETANDIILVYQDALMEAKSYIRGLEDKYNEHKEEKTDG